MILAVLKLTGTFADSPLRAEIRIENEDEIAIQRTNPETKKVTQLTIGQLYDLYRRKSTYDTKYIDEDEEVDPNLFMIWFNQKYITGKSVESRLIDIFFERV